MCAGVGATGTEKKVERFWLWKFVLKSPLHNEQVETNTT
jgi:hypothetical protein